LVRLATPAAVLGTALAAGCASDGKNMYEAPPNDGSANANSADVVTEPAITPK
jgi:outer membrane murein-binding lipoprotein Lpp